LSIGYLAAGVGAEATARHVVVGDEATPAAGGLHRQPPVVAIHAHAGDVAVETDTSANVQALGDSQAAVAVATVGGRGARAAECVGVAAGALSCAAAHGDTIAVDGGGDGGGGGGHHSQQRNQDDHDLGDGHGACC